MSHLMTRYIAYGHTLNRLSIPRLMLIVLVDAIVCGALLGLLTLAIGAQYSAEWQMGFFLLAVNVTMFVYVLFHQQAARLARRAAR